MKKAIIGFLMLASCACETEYSPKYSEEVACYWAFAGKKSTPPAVMLADGVQFQIACGGCTPDAEGCDPYSSRTECPTSCARVAGCWNGDTITVWAGYAENMPKELIAHETAHAILGMPGNGHSDEWREQLYYLTTDAAYCKK